MAYITIISLRNGGSKATSEYFFKNGIAGEKCSIRPGEVAEVPDNELMSHLETGLVMQVPGPEGISRPKPAAQKKAQQDGFDAVFSTQR